MKFSCYLLSNGNDTDPHSLFYGDKSMWTQTKRRSSEGCMWYLRLRLLRFFCLTRDPRNNEEWDPWQLSVTDFMIFKFNEFWVAWNTIAKPLLHLHYYLLYSYLKAQSNLKVCLLFIFSHLFYIYFTPSLYDLQHAIYGQRNWILMFLKSEIK